MRTEEIKNKELLPPNGTEALCRNLIETTYEDLSEENIRIFKDRLLDMTGCIFGGDIVPEDRFFYDMLKKQGGEPVAPAFADDSSLRLPLTSAVMHNCLHARANDFGNMAMVVFDDPIACHYGETILPMNLTLADVFGCRGKEFIANNIAAEDTVGRILYTLPVRWPTDMELGSSAAAAIAIRYYDFDVSQAKTAFSYGATNATDPGNSYYDYCQEFKLHNAESARCGILAAELAKGGWRGLEDPFFGNAGLISRKVGWGCLPDLYEKAFEDLGKRYFTEVRFKRGPGGMPTIATDRLGEKLRARILEEDGSFDPEKIRQVRILEPDTMRRNYYSNPFRLKDHTNALFSYAFACCCSLYHGERRVDLVQTPAILAHPRLVELAEHTILDTYHNDAGTDFLKAQVEMTDGRVFEAEEDFVGSMFAYPSREFLEKKFWDQFHAFGRLPRAVGEKIIELAGRIDTLEDMREYTSLLTVG
ncbi:MAG: MmgE/PrpD family protein [Lachnospiraceae bacterium]|nr:MmgE/PrpD family protein [Lachnospiraceae bacterium]